MKPFVYYKPESIEEAGNLLKHPWHSALAGGSDILGEMKDRLADVHGLVDLSKISGLSDISDEVDDVKIGSMVRLSDLSNDPVIQRRCRLLSLAAKAVATEQIRNIGTVGGNLCQRPRCWYYRNKRFDCLKKGGDICFAVDGMNKYHSIMGGKRCHIVHPSDVAVALMSLKASVNLFSDGNITSTPIEDFFVSPDVDITRENILGNGDVLTGISVPISSLDCSGVYLKAKERESMDFALVSVAINMRIVDGVIKDPGVAVGGISPVPLRLGTLESRLHNISIEDFKPKDAVVGLFESVRPMSQNGYKLPLIESYLERALFKAIKE